MFIDADTHVDECEDTWSYIPKTMEHIRPGTLTFLEGQAPSYLPPSAQRMWFIDGRVHQRQLRSDERTGTTADIRELRNIPGRLEAMDKHNVVAQVLYPTIFLGELTIRADVSKALCESWNRWVADRCSESNGRLRWVAQVPMISMPDAVVEMRRAREAGAVGIMKRGIECSDLQVADPYFDPIYEVAQELEMPICVHTSASAPYSHRDQSLSNVKYGLGFYTVQNALYRILESGMSKRFPALRFGFVEAGASWLSGLLWLLHAQGTFGSHMEEKHDFLDTKARHARSEEDRALLRDSRLFVTCEASERISGLVEELGDTNFMVGSDYGHADRAALLDAHREIVTNSGLSSESAQRLTSDNAAEFYGLL